LSKYATCAYLNAEGKKAWSDVFTAGEVPIQSIIPQSATLEGIGIVERVFLVDLTALTYQQQDAILGKLSKLSGASKDEILKEILKVGLPLRVKFTEGCGTSKLGFFI